MEKKIPKSLLNKLNPLLSAEEKIICVFKEPFVWETLQTKWLVLTDFRLAVISNTIFNVVSVEDFHIRDLDIELRRTKFGLFDLIVFKSKDKIIYQTAASKSRREESEDFVRTASAAITRRETALNSPAVNVSSNDVTNCDSITTIRELNKLMKEGAITETEFMNKKEEILRKL